MSDLAEPKAALRHDLRAGRPALMWKLEGIGERDLRMPRTPVVERRMSDMSLSTAGKVFALVESGA